MHQKLLGEEGSPSWIRDRLNARAMPRDPDLPEIYQAEAEAIVMGALKRVHGDEGGGTGGYIRQNEAGFARRVKEWFSGLPSDQQGKVRTALLTKLLPMAGGMGGALRRDRGSGDRRRHPARA